MMRLLAILSSMLVLLAAPAMAQTGNPAGMTPGTGPHQPNNPDRLFVRAAAIGGMAEVEFGKLAEQKGQSDAVKEFGRRMIEDHGKANERLIGLAKEDGIAVPRRARRRAQGDARPAREPERRRVRPRLPSGAGGGSPEDGAAPGIRDRLGPGCRAQELRCRDLAGRAPASAQTAQDIQAELTGKAS